MHNLILTRVVHVITMRRNRLHRRARTPRPFRANRISRTAARFKFGPSVTGPFIGAVLAVGIISMTPNGRDALFQASKHAKLTLGVIDGPAASRFWNGCSMGIAIGTERTYSNKRRKILDRSSQTIACERYRA